MVGIVRFWRSQMPLAAFLSLDGVCEASGAEKLASDRLCGGKPLMPDGQSTGRTRIDGHGQTIRHDNAPVGGSSGAGPARRTRETA
jgi:hypothetical protein